MDVGFPLSRQNFLTVSVYPIVSGRRLQLNALFLDERGQLVPNTALIPTTVAGIKTETEMQCLDGYLLSVTVTDDAATARNGEVYCTVSIKVGQVDTNSPIAMLARGYVSENSPVYYPGGKDRDALEGYGRFHSFTGVNPGAGNPYSLTLEAYKSYKLLSVFGTLTTSAVVANRYIYVNQSDDSGKVFSNRATLAYTESKAWFIHLSASQTAFGNIAGSGQFVALSRTTPFQGALKGLEIGAINMDAGDQITGIRITLEEYAELPGF